MNRTWIAFGFFFLFVISDAVCASERDDWALRVDRQVCAEIPLLHARLLEIRARHKSLQQEADRWLRYRTLPTEAVFAERELVQFESAINQFVDEVLPLVQVRAGELERPLSSYAAIEDAIVTSALLRAGGADAASDGSVRDVGLPPAISVVFSRYIKTSESARGMLLAVDLEDLAQTRIVGERFFAQVLHAGYSESLERSVTESSARAYSAISVEVADWIEVRSAWRTLRSTIESIDARDRAQRTDALVRAYDQAADQDEAQDAMPTRPRVIGLVPSRRDDREGRHARLLHALKTFENMLSGSERRRFFGDDKGLDAVARALDRAQLMYRLTDAGFVVDQDLQQGAGWYYELHGVGEQNWNRVSGSASYPDAPVEVRRVGERLDVIRVGYATARLMLLQDLRGEYGSVWRTIDYGLEFPEICWRLRDADGLNGAPRIEVEHLGAVTIRHATLREFLRKAGLPDGMRIVDTEVEQRDGVWRIGFSIDAEGIKARDVSAVHVSLDSEALTDPTALRLRLVSAMQERVRGELQSLRLPATADECFTFLPPWFADWTVEAAWIDGDPVLSLELWMRDSEQRGFRGMVEVGKGGFRISNLVGDRAMLLHEAADHIDALVANDYDRDALKDALQHETRRRETVLATSGKIADEVSGVLSGRMRETGLMPLTSDEIEAVIATILLDISVGDVDCGADAIAARVGREVSKHCSVVWAREESTRATELIAVEIARLFTDSPIAGEPEVFASVMAQHQLVESAAERVLELLIGDQPVEVSWLVAGVTVPDIRKASIDRALTEHLRSEWFRLPGRESAQSSDEARFVNSVRAAWASELTAAMKPEIVRASWGSEDVAEDADDERDTRQEQGVEDYFERYRAQEEYEEAVLAAARATFEQIKAFRGEPIDRAVDAMFERISARVGGPLWLRQALVNDQDVIPIRETTLRTELQPLLASAVLEVVADRGLPGEGGDANDPMRFNTAEARDRIQVVTLRWLRNELAASTATVDLSSERLLHRWLGDAARSVVRPLIEADVIESLKRSVPRDYDTSSVSGVFASRADPRVLVDPDGKVRLTFVGDVSVLAVPPGPDGGQATGHSWHEFEFAFEMNEIGRRAIRAADSLHKSRFSGTAGALNGAMEEGMQVGAAFLGFGDESYQAAVASQLLDELEDEEVISTRTQAMRDQLLGAAVDSLRDEISLSSSLSIADIRTSIEFARDASNAVQFFDKRVRAGVNFDESVESARLELDQAIAGVLAAQNIDGLRTSVPELRTALTEFQEKTGIEVSKGLDSMGTDVILQAVRTSLADEDITALYRQLSNRAALEFVHVERMSSFILKIASEDIKEFDGQLDKLDDLIRDPELMTPEGRHTREALVRMLRDLRTGLRIILPNATRVFDQLLDAIGDEAGVEELFASWDAARSSVEQDVADVRSVLAGVRRFETMIENLTETKPRDVPRMLRTIASAVRSREERVASGLGLADRLDELAARIDRVNSIVREAEDSVDAEYDRIKEEVQSITSAYEAQYDEFRSNLSKLVAPARTMRGKIGTPKRWNELVKERGGEKRVDEIEEMRRHYAALQGVQPELIGLLIPDLDGRLKELEARCIQLGELHARTNKTVREIDDAIEEASEALDVVLSQISEVQRRWEVVGVGVSETYNKVDKFLADTNLRESPELLGAMAEQLDSLGEELALDATGAEKLRALAGALDEGRAIFDDAKAFTEAVADLPEAAAADLAAAVKQPRVQFGWDRTKGVTLATSLDSLDDGSVVRALKNPVLRDSAISQWATGVIEDTVLQQVAQDVGDQIDEYNSELLAEAGDFADSLVGSADRTLDELFAELPTEIPFLGTTVQVSYGEGSSSLAVTLLHLPEPGSLVPEFEITGLFEVTFSANLEDGPQLRVSDQFNGRIGSLRAPLEAVLCDVLPGGLSLRGDPEIKNGRALVRFKYHPSAFPLPVLGEVEIPLDVSDVSVDIGIRQFRDAMMGLLIEELVVELNAMISEGGVPGVGPLTLSDRGEAIRPLEPVTGEFGFIVNGKLDISDILDVPVVIYLGIESGLKVKVDPNVLASVLGPLFDSLFGSDALFRIVPDVPLYTTGDRLRIHLLYEMDIPVLGFGLGGGMVLSSEGVDLGDGLTLKVPGWIEAPPLAFGNLHMTLQPSRRRLALGCSLTLTPGPASVSLVEARITGSMTYSEPVTISAEGVLNVFRVITLGDARVLVTPKYGSIEATVGSSPLIGDIFKLDGVLQIEADKARSRLLRNKHWNILYTTDTEVLGLASQTVEGGLTWEGEGLLAIEKAFAFAHGTGEVTFSDSFADPKLEFRGRIGNAGGIADISIDVIAEARGVLVSAQATVKGVPLGVTFMLTDIASLTPGRIADELLNFFDLSLSLDPAFSITNVPDSDLSGETGARGLPEEGSEGPPPETPASPDVPVGDLVWKRCVETKPVIIGYETSGGLIPFLRKDRPIWGTSYEFVSGAKRLNLPNAEAAWNQGAYFARESDRGHHLVTYANGQFDVYGGRPLKAIWSGRTDSRASGTAPSFALLPIMRSDSGALVAMGYGTSSDAAMTIAAMPSVVVPSEAARFRDVPGQSIDLTRINIGGVTIAEIVADGLDEQERQTISVMVTLVLAGASFDDFLVMGTRVATGRPVVLLERDSAVTNQRWAYTGLDNGNQVVARIDGQTDFSTEFLKIRYDVIGRALARYGDDPILGTAGDLGFIREVAFLTFGGDAALQDPFVAMIGEPSARGSSGGFSTPVWLGRSDGKKHEVEIHAEATLGADDIATHFVYNTQDRVSQQLQAILSDPTTDLSERMDIVVSRESEPSGALRRVAMLYKTTDGTQVFALCVNEMSQLDSPAIQSFDDVVEYWRRNRSAAPVGLALDFKARVVEYLRRLARDDWESEPDWRADPAGAFW